MKPDVNEALRYLGVKDAPQDLRARMEALGAQLAQGVQPKYTYKVYPLAFQEDGIHLEGAGLVLTGSLAGQMLAQCHKAALLACTLGLPFDQQLVALQARDMSRAVMLDACGSAFVEAGCDAAQEELSARFPGLYLTDRFSPGYGDLPLALQKPLCAALDTPRRLGLHVTESLLLNPVKSVTAVIGLSDRPQGARIRGCEHCELRETCTIRKGGERCGN